MSLLCKVRRPQRLCWSEGRREKEVKGPLDRRLWRPLRRIVESIGVTTRRRIRVHEEELGGEEGPLHHTVSVVGVLRTTEGVSTVLIKEVTDVLSWNEKTLETDVTHVGRTIVPETGDTSVNIRWCDGSVVLVGRDTVWPTSYDQDTWVLTVLILPKISCWSDDTVRSLVSDENTIERWGIAEDTPTECPTLPPEEEPGVPVTIRRNTTPP